MYSFLSYTHISIYLIILLSLREELFINRDPFHQFPCQFIHYQQDIIEDEQDDGFWLWFFYQNQVELIEILSICFEDGKLLCSELLMQLVQPISSYDLVYLIIHLCQYLLEISLLFSEILMILMRFTCLLDDLLKQHLVSCYSESRLQQLILSYFMGRC